MLQNAEICDLENPNIRSTADAVTVAAYFQGTTTDEVGDAAANTSTTASVEVGERFGGELSTFNDEDWIEINLEAGESYVFTVWGTNGLTQGLEDPALTLYNSGGSQLAFNEDIFFNFFNFHSQISYTATSTGSYYLGVSSTFGDSGDYIFQASTTEFSVQEVAAQISEIGWGIPTIIKHDENAGDTMTVNIANLTGDGQQLALWALESWSEILDIDFITTTSSGADILFDDNQAGAFAGPDSYNPNTGIIFSV